MPTSSVSGSELADCLAAFVSLFFISARGSLFFIFFCSLFEKVVTLDRQALHSYRFSLSILTLQPRVRSATTSSVRWLDRAKLSPDYYYLLFYPSIPLRSLSPSQIKKEFWC